MRVNIGNCNDKIKVIVKIRIGIVRQFQLFAPAIHKSAPEKIGGIITNEDDISPEELAKYRKSQKTKKGGGFPFGIIVFIIIILINISKKGGRGGGFFIGGGGSSYGGGSSSFGGFSGGGGGFGGGGSSGGW